MEKCLESLNNKIKKMKMIRGLVINNDNNSTSVKELTNERNRERLLNDFEG